MNFIFNAPSTKSTGDFGMWKLCSKNFLGLENYVFPISVSWQVFTLAELYYPIKPHKEWDTKNIFFTLIKF